jgi:two-component system response regulator EvgA
MYSATKSVQKNLSKRELEIMELLLNGERTKNISIKLNLKSNTVSTYKKLIYYKMGVDNIIALYKYTQNFELNKV